jgi:hypothetical protein
MSSKKFLSFMMVETRYIWWDDDDDVHFVLNQHTQLDFE